MIFSACPHRSRSPISTGDNLPDIFELNYIQDPEIGRLPKRNEAGNVIEAVGPGDFSPAMDRIGINDGSGGVRFTPISDQAKCGSQGFGCGDCRIGRQTRKRCVCRQ